MPKKYKKLNRSSCGMTYVSSYRNPCNKLPLNSDFISTQNGGFQDNLDTSVGCTSYNVDVNSPQIAGRTVISGNPNGCLNSQIDKLSSFNPPINEQNGGGNGASCSGVGFDLSENIGGQSLIVNNAPNCLYGEVANTNVNIHNNNIPEPILSGGGKKSSNIGRKSRNNKRKKINNTRRSKNNKRRSKNNKRRSKKQHMKVKNQ